MVLSGILANKLKRCVLILLSIFLFIICIPISFDESEFDRLVDFLVAEQCVYEGVMNGQVGKYQEAIMAFELAIEIKPDYEIAHYGLGLAHLSLDNQDAALVEFEILMSLYSQLGPRLYYKIYLPGGITLLG